MKPLIFSTTPAIGMLSFLNMSRLLLESSSETFCGVVTVIPAVTGTLCASVSCASPVPGGMSMTSTSRSLQRMSRRNCSIAFMTMAPRQMRDCPSSIRTPILITSTP